MSYSASRLTLWAVLSAIEEDLREMVRLHLGGQKPPRELLGDEPWERAEERLERDLEFASDEIPLEQILTYTDFSDLYKLLNSHSADLPKGISRYVKQITPLLEKLAPVRNRVAHTRPLDFDDVAKTLHIAEDLAKSQDPPWTSLKATMVHLQSEPSFVLGLEIPRYKTESTDYRHNLPTPDFDETGFVGRRQQVANLIKLCLGPYPVITIIGDGGSGKTALALKVAYDLVDLPERRFEAIVWTSSKTMQLTAQDVVEIQDAIRDSLGMLQHVARHLSGVSVDDPVQEVLSYLEQWPILLVLDNLETVMDDRIRSFLERLPVGSKVLITSRIGLGAFEYPVKLAAMEQDEALQLLRALAASRGAPELVKMPNKDLAAFCKRMHNNPGYIKWFVAAVQAGKRPEEVLAKPDVFLDFCMSNVYDYLSPSSRRVLRSILCLPGPLGQPELAFLNEMEVLELQRSLQQLLTTNMVTVSSIPRGSSFESKYAISDLARAYLSKHHPIEAEEYRSFVKHWQQLVATGEQVRASVQSNPYFYNSIVIRSHGDLVVARYLLDAIAEAKRKNFQAAEELVAKAHGLSPEYFEVHRVEALVKALVGDIAAARRAYEAAVDLEPQSAPLRLWYGGLLLRYLGDSEGALTQLNKAAELDPNSVEVRLEQARTNLYLKRFDEVRSIVGSLLARAGLSEWNLRKLYDLNLQLYQRRAEQLVSQHENLAALACLEELRQAYEACPPALADPQMKEKLARAANTARVCEQFIQDESGRATAKALFDWLTSEAGTPTTGQPEFRPGDLVRGIVYRLPVGKTFGFIRTDDGRDLFFHRNALGRASDWIGLREGAPVSARIGRNEQGICAVELALEAKPAATAP